MTSHRTRRCDVSGNMPSRVHAPQHTKNCQFRQLWPQEHSFNLWPVRRSSVPGSSRSRSPRGDSREREASMFGEAKRREVQLPLAAGVPRERIAKLTGVSVGTIRDLGPTRQACWAACPIRCRCWAAADGQPVRPLRHVLSPCSARPARTLPGLRAGGIWSSTSAVARIRLAAPSRPRTGRWSTEFGIGRSGCRPPPGPHNSCMERSG